MQPSPLGSFRAAMAALAIFGAVAAPIAQTVDKKPEVKTQVLARVSDILTQKAYVPGLDFSKWPSFIDSEKAKIDAAKDDEEFDRAVNEAIAKFGASHIYMATPRAASLRREARMVGIGVTQQTTPDGVLIIRTVPGAPADEAGLIPGDLIIKVDGEKAQGIKGIPGKEGTTVKLTVRHQNGKEQDFVVTRRQFSTVRKEELSEVDKDTAKLSIYTFDWTYDPENVETLMKKALTYKNLILDLRDNGGGRVSNLQHLLGMLMPGNDVVGTFVSKEMVDAYVSQTKGKPTEVAKIAEWSRHNPDFAEDQVHPARNKHVGFYHGNLVVIVNGFSGSASEICAAALHDDANASVVGQKSAGAVLVSMIWPLPNGFSMQFPVMDYVTVRGVRLEGTGVNPDVPAEEAKIRLPNTPDQAIEKAQMLFARAKLRDERSTGHG